MRVAHLNTFLLSLVFSPVIASDLQKDQSTLPEYPDVDELVSRQKQLDREMKKQLRTLLVDEWPQRRTPEHAEALKKLLDVARPEHVHGWWLTRRWIGAGHSMPSVFSYKRSILARQEFARTHAKESIWTLDKPEQGRAFFEAFGVRVPEMYAMDLPIADVELRSTSVIKPVDAAGSRGVYLVHAEDRIFYPKDGTWLDSRKAMLSHARDLLERKKVPQDNFMCEELIPDRFSTPESPKPAIDLKFYAFYGEVELVLEIEREPEVRYDYRNVEGKRLRPFMRRGQKTFQGAGFSQDDLETAKRLSAAIPYPFCRIDLLRGWDGAIGGEFTPAPGSAAIVREKWDRKWGKAWHDADLRLRTDLLAGKTFSTFSDVHSSAV